MERRMPRIAVFNMEIVGTVNPILPVVSELVKRGCDVRYYLTKETFVKAVKAVGASPIRFDEFFLRWDSLMEEEAGWFQSQGCEEAVAALTATGMEMEFLQFRMLYFALPAGVCLGRRLVESWSSKDWCPDLVLYNVMLLHPYLAACKLGLACVSFSTYPGPGTPMHLSEIPEEERQAFDEKLAQNPAMQKVNALAKSFFGVDVCGTQLQCRCYNRQLNVVFSVPQLQGEVPDYQQALIDDSTFLWAGACDDLKASAPRASAPEKELHVPAKSQNPWEVPPGVKVVIVSLGTLTVDIRWDSAEHLSSLGRFTGRQLSERLWSELIESFGGRQDTRFVLSVGPREDARIMLGELPPNFVAVEYIDQVQALRHADLFITHGGCNSIKEAALLGVPMIVVPFCVDQPSNGKAIERAGAGVCFPDPLATPRGAISDAVNAALGSRAAEQRRCSQKIGEALRQAGGPPAIAQACMSLLRPAAAGGA